MEQNMIIDNLDPGIVVTETSITISDEKLRGMLLRTYEAAQRNERRFDVSNLWGICWSIAGTLTITILTSSFNPIGKFSSDDIQFVAIVVCVVFVIVGIILSALRVRNKSSCDTAARDKSVDLIAKQYFGR